MWSYPANSDLRTLRNDLLSVRRGLIERERRFSKQLATLPSSRRDSARNLIHYLALRRYDVRELQERLAGVGLSSLGRSEAEVMPSLERLLWILGRLVAPSAARGECPTTPQESRGRRVLARNADALFGPPPGHRDVRIMVTMPSEAAGDYALVRELVARGTDCMRINCAHDDAEIWSRIAAQLDRARRELSRPCQLLIDLSGPKLRTGEIVPGPRVLKWRPSRDRLGRVVAPARIWLTPSHSPEPPPREGDSVLMVPGDWLSRTRTGARVVFTDARRKERSILLRGSVGSSRLGESSETAYVVPGTSLRLKGGGKHLEGTASVSSVPPIDGAIRLQAGDRLVLTRSAAPGTPPRIDRRGALLAPARVPCTLQEIFPQVKAGERIWFDDGRIGGVVRRARSDELVVEITQCGEHGSVLRSDKGINLPDSDLRLSGVTAKDLEDFGCAVKHADLIGMSFVQREKDVANLRHRLHAAGADHIGIVLKIETRRAFERLGELALAALREPRSGIMIARGDLAVECGYERLAEVQEEILWVCEAAHLPVIWATQVLDSLAKRGQPSRAEITDAAMGERAECVMLNKGPHIVKAVQVLDDILRRMQAHQVKKTAMLRRLAVAFGSESETGGGPETGIAIVSRGT
jgi:pyruvate kinase